MTDQQSVLIPAERAAATAPPAAPAVAAPVSAAPISRHEAHVMLDRIASAIANLPDRRDVPNTERALSQYDNLSNGLALASGRIRNALNRLPELTRTRDSVVVWISHLTTWRDEFQTRLAALPPREEFTTSEQEHEFHSLHVAIRVIDSGAEFHNGRAALGRALREKIHAAYPPTLSLSDPWEQGFGPLGMAQEQLKVATDNVAEVEHSLQAALAYAATLLEAPSEPVFRATTTG